MTWRAIPDVASNVVRVEHALDDVASRQVAGRTSTTACAPISTSLPTLGYRRKFKLEAKFESSFHILLSSG
jgi:hypothetical protein